MPRDTSQDGLRFEHPAHEAILVVLAYIPPRTSNFQLPTHRGEAVSMVRLQLQNADPSPGPIIYTHWHYPGKDPFFHLVVGERAGRDHARSPLFAS